MTHVVVISRFDWYIHLLRILKFRREYPSGTVRLSVLARFERFAKLEISLRTPKSRQQSREKTFFHPEGSFLERTSALLLCKEAQKSVMAYSLSAVRTRLQNVLRLERFRLGTPPVLDASSFTGPIGK